MDKPSIAIILEFGFHDIKKYLHSGFAARLSRELDIVWLAIDKENKEFHDYFNSTGYPLIYFKTTDFSQNELRTEKINQFIRSAWMTNKEIGTFHNYKRVKVKNLKSKLIGNDLLKSYFEKKTLREVKDHYYSTLLARVFKEYNVEFILGTNYGTSFSKCAFVTANRIGIKTYFLIGSWKDLYINNFIPFNFLKSVFVWSERMKRSYLEQMPYLKEESLIVSGNPTFDLLKIASPNYGRDYYSAKYNISTKAVWLLYTMMPPGLVNDEINTIVLIANYLLKFYSHQKLVIIIRRNPNHSKLDFIDITLPTNAVLADNYCTYDKARDLIVQSPEGESEWIDLLHYCTANLSVPSTVTLEILTLNKPVLNIGFGPDGKPDERIKQHFEAGFYKPMFENDLVMKVFHVEKFIDLIRNLLSKATLSKLDLERNVPINLASDRIIKSLKEN